MAGAFSRELDYTPPPAVYYDADYGVGTELKKRIDATGKEKLVVVGYMVQSCVSTTVRQAYDLEYCIVVPRDCVGARDIPGATAEEVLAHELAVLDDLYCHVVDSKELKDE